MSDALALHLRTCDYHHTLGTPWSNGLPCSCWRVAEAELAAARRETDTLLREIAEPLCDATFRARLLRQGLSTDEIAQYVEAVEALQARALAAVSAGEGTVG